jgi:hypothetical protein
VNEEVRKRSSRAPILVGKKVQHTFNEGTHNGKVISTVPGFVKTNKYALPVQLYLKNN